MMEEEVLTKVANYRTGSMNWAGGRLRVTREALTFTPNGPNRMVGNRESVEVPLREVRSVTHRRGVVTGIVVVTGDRGVVELRCWGSRDVVRLLRELTGTS